MRLENSDNILLDYIFIYILIAIYNINLNDNSAHNQNVASISERRKYLININDL